MNKPLVPHITEKAFALIPEESGSVATYTFKVPRALNKDIVKRQIESQFKVTVEEVRIVNLPGKVRRFKNIMGRTQAVKKALVRLKKGDRIADFLPEAPKSTDKN
jgi:large subunit ribosomal protein L23